MRNFSNYVKIFLIISNHLGPFTIIIKDLKVFGVVKLGVDSSGKLRAQNVETDLKVAHMSVDFQNLGVLKSLLGSFVNSKDDSVSFLCNISYCLTS